MISPLDRLIQRYPELSICLEQIRDGGKLLSSCFANDGKLLLCGNGGSASDADHWAGELLKGFESLRPLSPAMREGLPQEMANRLQRALPAIPLTGFPAFASAFSNDVEPEYLFAQLVLALGKPGDVLAVLSTSGNSKNICNAAEVARARGLQVLALTGETGGVLKNLADICICVPATRTLEVQELHLPIYHSLSLVLEEELK